jgi:hypothetical protein
MKYYTVLAMLCLLFISCDEEENKQDKPPTIDWEQREAQLKASDSLINGKSYLPIYSRIYHHKRNKTIGLTVTVSLRNVSTMDTVYLLSADLYDTSGGLVRGYIEKPVFLKPMETLEIIIEETENDGGTGGNFVFEWASEDINYPPLFEGVMISTLGQQGISFTSRAIRVE